MKNTLQKTQQKYKYSIVLLKQLVLTDFKLRYQNSVLGYLWSVLRPLSLFFIMYVVFVYVFKANYGVKSSAVYLLTGIILWNYFSEVTNVGVSSIVAKGDLLRKLNFPKYIIVLSGSFTALINLLINFLVVAFFATIGGVSFNPHIFLIPFLVIEVFVLSISGAFFLSALYVRLRDVNYIWEVIMQAAFYGTPILYSLKLEVFIKHPLLPKLLLLNPMAQIIQDTRYAILGQNVPTIATVYNNPAMRLVPLLMVILACWLSVTFFKKRSKTFAEEI